MYTSILFSEKRKAMSLQTMLASSTTGSKHNSKGLNIPLPPSKGELNIPLPPFLPFGKRHIDRFSAERSKGELNIPLTPFLPFGKRHIDRFSAERSKGERFVAVLLAVVLFLVSATAANAQAVCQIGSTNYNTFASALIAHQNGQTIKLLTHIDYNDGVIIRGKSITFDVGVYKLNIVNPAGKGLEVIEGAEVKLSNTGGGQLNVTGTTHGLYVHSQSSAFSGMSRATVTNATATGDYGYGVSIENTDDVTVRGDVKTTGYGGIGAYSWRGVAVSGIGNRDAALTIGGNIICTGSNSFGARANIGTITCGGIDVPSNGVYIHFTHTYSGADEFFSYYDFTLPTTKAGYLTYQSIRNSGTKVWVRGNTPPVVCTIPEKGWGFYTLKQAIAAQSGTDRIQLLDYISQNEGIYIDNKYITFLMNGKNIFAHNPNGYGMSVENSVIDMQGAGYFDVSGTIGLDANNSVVKISRAIGAPTGVKAENHSNVIIQGYVSASFMGVSSNNSSVTVTGDVTVSDVGSGSGFGVQAINGGVVTIDGAVNVPSGLTYVKVGTTLKSKFDYTLPTTKAGYATYTDGTNTVWVKETGIQPPVITTPSGSLKNGAVGVYYRETLTATNTPATFALSGTLPPGLTLNAATGEITGSPSATGNFRFNITATNPAGTSAPVYLDITINVAEAAMIYGPSNRLVPIGGNTSFDVNVTGNPEPTVWWEMFPVGGANWITLTDNATFSGTNTKSLKITNVPSLWDGALFRCTAFNLAGPPAVSNPATLSVVTGVAPTIVTDIFSQSVTEGGSVTFSVTATGVPMPNYGFEWQYSTDGGVYWRTNPANATYTWGVGEGTMTLTNVPFSFDGYKYRVVVYNAVEPRAYSSVATLTVNPYPLAPVITTPAGALSNCNINGFYSYTLTATNNPRSWAVTSGALPAQISLNNEGVISGYSPMNPGTYTFGVTASNGAGPSPEVIFSITINDDNYPPVITTPAGALPDGTIGVPYSFKLQADNQPSWWVFENGVQPWGMWGIQLDPSNGTIYGTPNYTGTHTFNILCANPFGESVPVTFSLTINDAAPVITTSAGALSVGTVGSPYSFTLAATNSPTIWAEVTPGTLPPGLSINNHGAITGTPTTAGTYNFSLTATNGAGTSTAVAFSIVIVTTAAAPVITTPAGALGNGVVGVPYNKTLTADNSPTSWALVSGVLPLGLSINASGVISGTPTTAGAYTFEVTASNSTGTSASVAFSITIAANATPPAISTVPGALTAGTVGTVYTFAMVASGAPTSWAVASGALPGGLTISNTGIISGTPTVSGLFTFELTATNDAGTSMRVPFSITISNVILPPVISTAVGPLTQGYVGVAYTETLAAMNMPTGWAVVAGALPDGLTINASGVISGTPTVAGMFSFLVSASNAGGSSMPILFSIKIEDVASAPFIATTAGALMDGIINRPYSRTLLATDNPTSWAITAGSLPVGLTFDVNTGEISGTPTVLGTSNFTVTATNGIGTSAPVAFSITIVPEPTLPPDITTPAGALTAGVVNVAYAVTLAATNSPSDWAIASGALPAGLSLNASGIISGIPTAAGTSNFTVTASNLAGTSAAVAFSITIDPAPVTTFYTVNIASMTGGSVYPSKSTAEAGETITLTIAPETDYEMTALTVNAQTNGQWINVSGSGNNFTFTMPADNVTVTATFRSPTYQSRWAAAQALIDAATFTLTQQQAPNAETTRFHLAELINELIKSTGFVISAYDIVIFTFNPAEEGTADKASGVNGSFAFRVTPPSTDTSAYSSGAITATPVGNGELRMENGELRGWSRNGILHVSGLVPGSAWSVYSMTGVMIYQGIANDDKAELRLAEQGIYIIVSGSQRIKTVHQN